MGAWTRYYKYPDTYTAGTPHGYAILAIKRQLIDIGHGKNIKADTLQYGNYVRDNVKNFQRAQGIEVDGVIGPVTSKKLWLPRVKAVQAAQGIPDDLLCKKTGLESGWDPAAVGSTDPRDRGMNQINSGAHPDVSDAEAFDPFFSLTWAGRYLSDLIKAAGDVDAGLAAYNVGLFYAKKWLTAGKPESGVFTATGKDIAVIATRYVRLVRAQTC